MLIGSFTAKRKQDHSNKDGPKKRNFWCLALVKLKLQSRCCYLTFSQEISSAQINDREVHPLKRVNDHNANFIRETVGGKAV